MLKFYLIIFLIGLINSEIISFQPCQDSDDNICEIKEVRVSPCKEAKNNKPCKIKSGTNATIQFDYIPHFESENLVTQAYSATGFLDLPLLGMDRTGCKYTECPVKNGENASYTNILYISPSFPTLGYNVKWRIWNFSKDNEGCCFIFKIKLI